MRAAVLIVPLHSGMVQGCAVLANVSAWFGIVQHCSGVAQGFKTKQTKIKQFKQKKKQGLFKQ